MSRFFGFVLGVGLGSAGAWWLLQPNLRQKAAETKQKLDVKAADLKLKAEDLKKEVKERAAEDKKVLKEKVD